MARYLGEAVESVFAQRECDWEIVIVNDGSTDGSADVARRYASERVRVVDEGVLGGPGAARNRGVLECRADAFVFLDADDRLRPRALARLVGAIEADPSLAVAYGEVLTIDAEGRPIGTGRRPAFGRRPSGDALLRLLRGNPIPAPGAACIRRSHLERAGPFGNLAIGEDWELYCRLALTGRFLYLRGDPILEYRRHPGSQTMARAERFEALLPSIEAIFGNPALRARLPGWVLREHRRRCVAGCYGYAGRTALRKGRWAAARRNLFECLRRDPWRPREAVLLLGALVERLPDPLRRLIK
jgi:glycosyltransferase involved in cell wall biosynthesis